jgi:hypothetical protein
VKKAAKKAAKKISPTQQALKHYRALGYTLAITERWNPFAKVRQDLFGFIDLVAMKAGEPIIAIQATSSSNVSARLKKIRGLPTHLIWLKTGARIVVFGCSRIIEIIQGDADADFITPDE